MRISQLESFSPLELATLLYIVNEVAPVSPKIEFTPKLLLAFKNDILISKLNLVQPKASEEGKSVLSLIASKLKKSWIEEVKEYKEASKPNSIQLEFIFDYHPTTELAIQTELQ